MKKEKLTILLSIFVLMFILLILNVSAVSTDIKDKYEKQETAIFKIYGDITSPINKEDVKFYRKNVLVPLESEVVKIANDYYVWFVSSTIEGNYTLIVDDISTSSGLVSISKNFSIGNTTKSYYVVPGVVSTNADFKIDVYLYGDNPETVTINYPGKSEQTLNPGKTSINFDIDSISNTQITSIGIGEYNIPAYLIVKGEVIVNNNETNTSIVQNGTGNLSLYYDLRILPIRIDKVEQIGKNITYSIEIINYANVSAKNISFDFNQGIFKIMPQNIDLLNVNESKIVNVSLLVNESIREIIYVRYGNNFSQIPVLVEFSNNQTKINASQGSFDCNRDLGGQVCAADEICTKQSISSRQGTCCLGSCAVKEEESSSWIGWVLIGLALLIIVYVIYKYRGVKNVKNPIEKKVKEIEKEDIGMPKGLGSPKDFRRP